MAIHARESLDPVTFEVLQNAFHGIADEMNRTIVRVSLSLCMSEAKDSMGAVYSHDGHLVGSGRVGLPVMMGTFEPKLKAVIDFFGLENMEEGDVYLINQPHEAGSHLMDVTAVMPVLHNGEIVALLADGGHWTDIGGQVPGGFNLMAKETYAEGLYIPPIKIVDRGSVREDIVEMILSNVRLRDESRGDLFAMLKTLDLGRTRILDLVDRYGAATIRAAYEAVYEYSERILWQELSSMRDGTFYAEDKIDEDPLDPERGPIYVRLKMTKKGKSLTFDWTASDPDTKGALGIVRPCLESAVYDGLLNMYPSLAYNYGFTRNLKIVTRPESVVHAVYPSSVSGGWACAHGKAMGCIYYAVGEADPDRKVACPHDISNFLLGGHDADRDRPFCVYIFEGGGMGGSVRQDAAMAPQHNPITSGSANQSVELQERWFPMLLHKYMKINYDSMGAGMHRGGPGIERGLELVRGEATISCYADRYLFPPWGREGGSPGGTQNVILNRGRPDERSLGVKFSDQRMRAGESVTIQAAGGGGYGDPTTRDPEHVLRDVTEGLLSPDQARDLYRVAVRTLDSRQMQFELDATETHRLRTNARAQ